MHHQPSIPHESFQHCGKSLLPAAQMTATDVELAGSMVVAIASLVIAGMHASHIAPTNAATMAIASRVLASALQVFSVPTARSRDAATVMVHATILGNVSVILAGQVETVPLCSCVLTLHAQVMVNARMVNATAFLDFRARSVFQQGNATHHARQTASATQLPTSANAKWDSQDQIAALELMGVMMTVMAEDCASMVIACAAQDGTVTHVKSDTQNLGLLLLHLRRQQRASRIKQVGKGKAKGNRRLLHLEEAVGLHKQLPRVPHKQWAWVRHVEKVVLALDTASVTQKQQRVSAKQAGMELYVTFSIVRAGMARWAQSALATDFAIQVPVSVPQVGEKILTRRTRPLQMCARIRSVRLVAGTMENVWQVPAYVSRVGPDPIARIPIVVHQHVVAMGNVHLFRHMHLDNVCATMDGEEASAIARLCIRPCGSVPTTAVGMASVLMANASATWALTDLTAQARSVQILLWQGPGVTSRVATTIVPGRACA